MGDVPTNDILLCQFHLIYSVKNQRLKIRSSYLTNPFTTYGILCDLLRRRFRVFDEF